ncbi:MAG: hypothetical protein IKU69_03060 [Roseburia sp.]|nr:hypothetical protein [Roseburia sp.]
MATKKTTASAAKVETKKVEAKVETKVEAPVKEVEVKVEAVKAEPVVEVKEEVKKAPAKKAATKTETAKKETVKKETTKKAATKTTAKKAVAPAVVLQFGGQEVNMDAVVENAKNAFVAEGHKESEIKEFQIYVKPEEYAAYYVINGVSGRINLF